MVDVLFHPRANYTASDCILCVCMCVDLNGSFAVKKLKLCFVLMDSTLTRYRWSDTIWTVTYNTVQVERYNMDSTLTRYRWSDTIWTVTYNTVQVERYNMDSNL